MTAVQFISGERDGIMDFKHTQDNGNDFFEYDDCRIKYVEWLYNGVLLSCGFVNGGPNWRADANYLKFPDRTESSVFIVELDGMSLIDHWEFIESRREDSGDCLSVSVLLRHRIVGTEVAVCTKLDGTGCISRWIEVRNTSDHACALTRLAVMSGRMEYMESWKNKIREDLDTPYRLGYFENTEWRYEGQFKWHELHSDKYSFGGRFNRFRYRHPFCVLENRIIGVTYAMQLAYSGGYQFTFDFRKSPAGEGVLAFAAEIDGLKPIRMIESGETLRSPEILVSKVIGDLDGSVQQMHEHIRNNYIPKSFRGKVFIENRGVGNVGDDKENAGKALENGYDIYYRDADWFSEEPGNYLEYSGDWEASPGLYPNGFRELSDYCRSIGIRVGLWMETERIGSKSRLMKSDHDMFMKNEKDEIIHGELDGIWFSIGESGFYNLSRKDVCDKIEAEICRVLEETGVNFFRLDCNIDYYAPWVMNWEDGRGEAVDFRYNENMYAMWDRIRRRFPDTVFENCASGGGRTDLGMLRFFDHTWISDNLEAPRAFTIFNGMSMCLPPEILTALRLWNHVDPDYHLMLAMFTRPSLPITEKTGKFMKYYREFARPFLPTCRLFHHTPAFRSFDATGVGVLEAASDDRTRDMLGLFCNFDPGQTDCTVKLKGINASFDYKITDYRTEETFTVSGYDLKYRGINVPLRGALTAELLMMEKI